jgi:hypothetical protein
VADLPPIQPLTDTLAQRGDRYASFRDNSQVAQALKDVMRQAPNWPTAPGYVREALDMIASKISRMLTGDTLYEDNFHDIQGYANLMEGYAAEDRRDHG